MSTPPDSASPPPTDPPPQSPEAAADPHHNGIDDYELPIAGFKGTPEEIERQWFEQCYTGRGDRMWQLTWRAVIMGSILGGILSLTNLYIGLKAGWGFGVAITACILSYSIWTVIYKVGMAKTPMTILENNCMQSTASSAGYSTGGTLVSAFAAYILLNDQTLDYWMLMAWVFFLAVLGVTMAIPMKRQMINTEQLRFPSGIAAAETLKALHSTGDKGMRSAKALGIAGLVSGLFEFWNNGLAALFPSAASFSIGSWMHKLSAATLGPLRMSFTTAFVLEPIFMAAGIFTGMRVCLSMFVSATLCWFLFCPIMLNNGTIKLTIREPLPYVPAGVNLEEIQENTDYQWIQDQTIKFRTAGTQRNLQITGIMTPAQRDSLLSESDDLFWNRAIHRAYIRSQYRAAVPLESLPTGVDLGGELEHVVSFDPEQGLIAESLMSMAQYEKLRNMSDDPAWNTAINDLYEVSHVKSIEPIWVAASLEALPDRSDDPEQAAKQKKLWKQYAPLIRFNEADNLLLWRGPMSQQQYEQLATLFDDAAYRAAVDTIFDRAQERSLPAEIPQEAAGIVRYDEENAALVAIGAIPSDLATKLRAASQDPRWTRTVDQLVAASQTSRATANFRDLVNLSLWAGTACMVTSGLLAFALQWKSAVRAFGSLGKMFTKKATVDSTIQERMDAIETPGSWFVGAQLFSLIGISYLAYVTFDMPIWQSVLAVFLSFGLALVACRVTGETDTTPVGAMGKIMQLIYGGIAPASVAGGATKAMNINLMAANITAAAAGGSADLLTDLKSGYLLGAHPRKQFIAQFSGIFIGTIVTVSCFSVLVPTADVLGSDTFPAPAALTWSAVAEAMSVGLHKLGTVKIWCIVLGGLAGILMPLLAVIFPKHAKYMPSAAGVGLAWTFHWYYSLMFFLGAVIGLIWAKRAPKHSEEFSFPIASGVVAGGALMGVALIFIENGPDMLRQIFGW